MKPNFALDFRNDVLTLLHRTPRGWQTVGQTRLDVEDLAVALSYMRATALGLSPDGITTKLVIPNSQILYTTVHAPAADAGRRRKQVARALEGRTPYAVADLAFDIGGSGPDVKVAVIARETLAEAEAFAVEHRFNPVAFVAVPDVEGFGAEPWFGTTSCAGAYLSEGQRVERDTIPIVNLTRDLPEQTKALPEPIARAPAAAADEPAPHHEAGSPGAGPGVGGVVADNLAGSDPVTPIASNVMPEAHEALTQAELALAAPIVDAAPEVPTLPADQMPEASSAAMPPEADPVAISDVSAQPQAIVLPGQTVNPSELSAEIAADAHSQAAFPGPVRALGVAAFATDLDARPGKAAPVVDEAPMVVDVVDELPDDSSQADVAAPPPAARPVGLAGVLEPSIPDETPATPPASLLLAFGSRRAQEASAKAASLRADDGKFATGKAPGLGGVTATRTGKAAKVTTLPPGPAKPDPMQSDVVKLPSRGVAPIAGSAAVSSRPAAKPAGKSGVAGKAFRGLGALVTSPSIAGAKERRAIIQTVTPPTGPSTAASAAAATLTTAKPKPYGGGLGSRNMTPQKPRYLGLILTGILLVFLALVAAWSTLFLEARDTGGAEPATVAEAELPTPDDEMLADLQGPDQTATDTEAGPDFGAPADPPADPEVDLATVDVPEAIAAPAVVAAPLPVAEPAPVTDVDIETSAALTPTSDPQDEIFLASMDEPPVMLDALSLPQPPERRDAPPGAFAPPPPFGTVYQFDANGLIVATPDGIVTPEGVMLFAGRPTLEPPPRPASLAAQTIVTSVPAGTETAADAAPVVDTGTAPETTADVAPADPALAGARPRARPQTLTPPTQNAEDDASLAPAAGSRFASLRPRANPSNLVAATAPVPPADPIAELGAQAASLTAQANATAATRGPLTLAVSRKPEPRPQDLSRAVEAAVAVASRQPLATPPVEEPAPLEAATQTASAAGNTEIEADSEPEVASAMPRLPTKASVSKQATFVNAINLSKVNLIGVYGTPSNRYALIRQTNGRYKKVEIGDSFDGGRVAAITASEVRYQKSGKMVTLAMPKG